MHWYIIELKAVSKLKSICIKVYNNVVKAILDLSI